MSEIITDFGCPICNAPIVINDSQVYCYREVCSFNPTVMDLLDKLYTRIK